MTPVDVVLPSAGPIGTLAAWSGTDVPALRGSGTAGAGRAGDVFASFDAHAGQTLAATTAGAGGGHWDWLNLVYAGGGASGTSAAAANTPRDPTAGTVAHVPFPWVDPVSGGNSGFGYAAQPADAEPFYWGELAGDSLPLGPHMTATSLTYFDHPVNLTGVYWDVATYLCAVPGDAGQSSQQSFLPVTGFTWRFTQGVSGEVASGLSLAPLDASSITGINQALRNSGFAGWSAALVPEPAAAAPVVVPLVAGLFTARAGRPQRRPRRAGAP
jgi:hypothetical protein